MLIAKLLDASNCFQRFAQPSDCVLALSFCGSIFSLHLGNAYACSPYIKLFPFLACIPSMFFSSLSLPNDILSTHSARGRRALSHKLVVRGSRSQISAPLHLPVDCVYNLDRGLNFQHWYAQPRALPCWSPTSFSLAGAKRSCIAQEPWLVVARFKNHYWWTQIEIYGKYTWRLSDVDFWKVQHGNRFISCAGVLLWLAFRKMCLRKMCVAFF